MKLFLDANVLFTAAHNPNGKAALVIELGARGHWQLCASHYALEEAARNLERKFPDALAPLQAALGTIEICDHRSTLDYPPGLPAKDVPIFQAALAAKATHLLTGDMKDFGPLMDQPENTFGVHVLTVARFLDVVLG